MMQMDPKTFAYLYQGCFSSCLVAPDLMGTILEAARVQVEIKA